MGVIVSFLCETDIFMDLHGSHPSLPTNLKIEIQLVTYAFANKGEKK